MRPKIDAKRAITRFLIPLAVLFFALALWPGCTDVPYQEPQPGVVSRWDFSSSLDGFGIPCSVYLPSGYNPAVAYPIWLELHALYAKPLLTNDPNNPFSTELKRLADERGWIIVAPWGRNMHSLFADGMRRDRAPYEEPEIYDDFSSGATSWRPESGSWQVEDGLYRQTNSQPYWKESVRLDSVGKDYAVRVRIRDLSDPGVASAAGVNLRRADNGDCYHVDLYRDLDGSRYVRFFKLVGGEWQVIYSMRFDWKPLLPADGWIYLKFSVYEEYLEVYVNEEIVNMQPGYDATPYGYGRDVPGAPLAPGSVSLCSYGGVHEFDDVRIQNEYRYGESDVLDCLLGTMEKYRIDPARIYVAGHSQGGLGAYILGTHHPDLCAALRPADGFSDIYYDYTWLETYYPENPGSPYADINDGRLTEYMRMLAGGEPAGNAERMSVLNANSARYLLENAINNHWRIVHGTPDSNVPNTYDPVQICWWSPFWFFWSQSAAPAPYNPASATYANGKDIADLLQSWSSTKDYHCEYLTNPLIGHGFMDPYADTADFFQDKALNRRPSEVAYKTFDDVNDGAWWLRLEIPNPGTNQPGMARVEVDAAANSAALHARNLTRLTLDLDWMGLDYGAGRTVALTLDDDTSPNAFPITDTTGEVDLELYGAWTSPAGYTVRLDGVTLQSGIDYSFQGPVLSIPGLATGGGHQLNIQAPSTLPDNLAPNPGLELEAGGGYPLNWTAEGLGESSAHFLWEELEAHGGARSLRIKDADLSGSEPAARWISDGIAVAAGREYQLSAFCKARLLRGAQARLGIAWYDYRGGLLSVSWSDAINEPGTTLSGEWAPVGFKARAPAWSTHARLLAGVEAPSPAAAGGSAWFDDFSFTRW